MAVVTVAEKMGVRTGGQDERFKRYYSRVFLVTTDDRTTEVADILADSRIPVHGTQYKPRVNLTDKGAYARNRDVRETSEDGLQWEVTVTYGPLDPNQTPQNPTDYPVELSWSHTKFETAVDQDKDLNAILNSADDKFDPPVMMDDSRPVLRVTRNEPSYDPSLAYAYKDAINSDVFFGAPAHHWKVSDISADLKHDPDAGWYYTVTYEFEYNYQTWVFAVLDQGYRKLVSGARHQILKDNAPITSPVLLDGSGGELSPGGTPVFIDFHVYREVAFSGLNIPQTGLPGQPGSGA